MDQAAFHFINQQWTSPALDLFMAALSDVEIWKPLLILVVLAVLIFGRFKSRAFLICLALTLFVSDAIVVKALKSAIGRARPKQVQVVRMVQLQKTSPKFLTLGQRPTIRYSDETDRGQSGPSFPSGHVTDNVIIAMSCLLFFPRWGWLYFILAGAIGYSRIYLGAHWPSDVLGTVFMAMGETLLMFALLEFLWRQAAPRFTPGLFARYPRLIGKVAQASSLLPAESQAESSRHVK